MTTENLIFKYVSQVIYLKSEFAKAIDHNQIVHIIADVA